MKIVRPMLEPILSERKAWRFMQAHPALSSVLARFQAAYPERGTWSRVESVRWFCTWLDGQPDTLAPAERDDILAAIVDNLKQAEDAIDRQVERLAEARQALVDAGIPVNDVDVAIARIVHTRQIET